MPFLPIQKKPLGNLDVFEEVLALEWSEPVQVLIFDGVVGRPVGFREVSIDGRV